MMFDPTQTVSIGRTGMKITRLSLGTAFLGGMYEAVTDERFGATVDAAYLGGINYFDTSPDYGMGISEQRLGRVLATKPRDTFVLSTKVGQLIRTEETVHPGAEVEHWYDNALVDVPLKIIVVDFSYDAAMRSFEESLDRMGLDRIDIVFIHDTFTEAKYKAAMQGTYRALESLRSQKVVRAIGVGIGMTNRLIDFAHDGDFDCFLVAGRYTLLDQSALAELLPLCVQKHIAVIIGAVFNSGILADPHRAGTRFDYQPARQELLAKAQHIDEICTRYGIPLKAAALQFPMAHPAVTSILTGSTHAEEINENLRLVQIPIPASFWSDLQSKGLLTPEVPHP
jgi:D-threo-aldose 1-dehydrogenase